MHFLGLTGSQSAFTSTHTAKEEIKMRKGEYGFALVSISLSIFAITAMPNVSVEAAALANTKTYVSKMTHATVNAFEEKQVNQDESEIEVGRDKIDLSTSVGIGDNKEHKNVETALHMIDENDENRELEAATADNLIQPIYPLIPVPTDSVQPVNPIDPEEGLESAKSRHSVKSEM